MFLLRGVDETEFRAAEPARRVDYEYERAGTASVFLFSEPLAGWRQPEPIVRRPIGRWRSPACWRAATPSARRSPCCATTSTRTRRVPFYEVFEPVRARELVRRLEFCYTPKHGSWLNIAENELSAMTRQCLRERRIGDLETLHAVSTGR